MTNLTEQWKKGKLPDGWYYVKGNRAEGKYAYTAEYLNNMYRPRNGEIIIEQVPSYELWKAVHEQWKVLLDENTKLKEQLKECELWFTGVVGNMNDKNCGEHNRNLPIGNFEHVFKVFSQKINQVLGEE
jgi:hypothetical protein